MSTTRPPSEGPDSVPSRFRIDFIGAQLLDVYDVRERLAEGGMGSVYLADDRSLGRPVVIKVPHARFLNDAQFLTRFSREIGELVRLEHPHIVRILAQGQHDDVPFFVLQYLAGGSLEDRLDKATGGRLPRADILAWAATIADTLDFIHEHGTIHRDVKPDNILFDENGHVYLSDFGVAKVLAGESVKITDEHACIGSPEHMAPEQGLGRDLSPSADQYALASMVYTAICGRPPYQGNTPIELLVKRNDEDPTPLHEVVPDVPLAASDAVHRAMSRTPDERFPSCSAFLRALEAAFEPAAVAPTTQSTSWRRVAVFMTIGAVLVGAMLWFFERNRGDGRPQRGSIEAMMDAYQASPPANEAEFRAYIERLTAMPGETAARALHVVYADFVAGPGRDDPEARRVLGHREFTYEVPALRPGVHSRAYAFVRGVEWARERRWFAENEEVLWQLALEARSECEAHWTALVDDAHVRARDAVHLQVEQTENLVGYHLAWHWDPPYLLCLLSHEPLSRYDLLAIDDGASLEQRASELSNRQAEARRALETEARLLKPLYRSFREIFGSHLGLEDLMAPHGGRPDLDVDRRAYPDGTPLLALIFERETDMRRSAEIPSSMGADCHFDSSDGWLYMVRSAPAVARDPYAAQQRTNTVLHEAVRQLHFWFTKQRNGWSAPAFSLDWFTEGVADWLAGLRIDEFRKTATPGVNEVRRESLSAFAEVAKKANKPLVLLPLESLTGTRNLLAGSLTRETELAPHIAAALALDQSWAFVHFLWSFEDGRYRQGLLRYAESHGAAPPVDDGPREALAQALGIENQDDWARLNQEFRTYVLEDLLSDRGG